MNDGADAALIARELTESAEVQRRLAEVQSASLARAAAAVAAALRRGSKLLLFGNGGSAADAQHIAAEFVGRFRRDRRPWPAVALTTDTSALTAIGNDYGFDEIFARQVRAVGRAGDVAVAISTSGRSPNVLRGVAAARSAGLVTIGLTGGEGGALAGAVDIAIVVPSGDTARIQEAHIAAAHAIGEVVERALADDRPAEATPSGVAKVHTLDALLARRDGWRRAGLTVVWTNGCFDLLHLGHVRSLEAARAEGDVLVVGVNGDASVTTLKGPGRPVVPAAERAAVVAALGCVDAVLVFDEASPDAVLERLQPDVHCKGGDYAPPSGRPVPEAALVASYGGRVAFTPLVEGLSTTDLVQRVLARYAGVLPRRDEPVP